MREDITKSFRRGFSSKATFGNTEEFGSMSFLSGFGKRRSLNRRSLNALPTNTPTLSWNLLGNKTVDTQAFEKRILTLEGDVATARSEAESAKVEIKALEGKVSNRDAILRKRALIIQQQQAQIGEDAARIEEQEEAVSQLEAFTVAQEEEHQKLLQQCREFAKALKDSEERVEGLENMLERREGELALVKGQLVEQEENVFQTEREVSDLKHLHRPKPIRAVVKTLVYAGTGALVAIASAGSR